jgi:hypothetical protein
MIIIMMGIENKKLPKDFCTYKLHPEVLKSFFEGKKEIRDFILSQQDSECNIQFYISTL